MWNDDDVKKMDPFAAFEAEEKDPFAEIAPQHQQPPTASPWGNGGDSADPFAPAAAKSRSRGSPEHSHRSSMDSLMTAKDLMGHNAQQIEGGSYHHSRKASTEDIHEGARSGGRSGGRSSLRKASDGGGGGGSGRVSGAASVVSVGRGGEGGEGRGATAGVIPPFRQDSGTSESAEAPDLINFAPGTVDGSHDDTDAWKQPDALGRNDEFIVDDGLPRGGEPQSPDPFADAEEEDPFAAPLSVGGGTANHQRTKMPHVPATVATANVAGGRPREIWDDDEVEENEAAPQVHRRPGFGNEHGGHYRHHGGKAADDDDDDNFGNGSAKLGGEKEVWVGRSGEGNVAVVSASAKNESSKSSSRRMSKESVRQRIEFDEEDESGWGEPRGDHYESPPRRAARDDFGAAADRQTKEESDGFGLGKRGSNSRQVDDENPRQIVPQPHVAQQGRHSHGDTERSGEPHERHHLGGGRHRDDMSHAADHSEHQGARGRRRWEDDVDEAQDDSFFQQQHHRSPHGVGNDDDEEGGGGSRNHERFHEEALRRNRDNAQQSRSEVQEASDGRRRLSSGDGYHHEGDQGSCGHRREDHHREGDIFAGEQFAASERSTDGPARLGGSKVHHQQNEEEEGSEEIGDRGAANLPPVGTTSSVPAAEKREGVNKKSKNLWGEEESEDEFERAFKAVRSRLTADQERRKAAEEAARKKRQEEEAQRRKKEAEEAAVAKAAQEKSGKQKTAGERRGVQQGSNSREGGGRNDVMQKGKGGSNRPHAEEERRGGADGMPLSEADEAIAERVSKLVMQKMDAYFHKLDARLFSITARLDTILAAQGDRGDSNESPSPVTHRQEASPRADRMNRRSAESRRDVSEDRPVLARGSGPPAGKNRGPLSKQQNDNSAEGVGDRRRRKGDDTYYSPRESSSTSRSWKGGDALGGGGRRGASDRGVERDEDELRRNEAKRLREQREKEFQRREKLRQEEAERERAEQRRLEEEARKKKEQLDAKRRHILNSLITEEDGDEAAESAGGKKGGGGLFGGGAAARGGGGGSLFG